MKFTAAEEYGLRCLIQVGQLPQGQSITIAEISRLEGLTVHNVAKLLRILRRGGFVNSVRGQTGGYELARPAEEIAVGEVLAFLGGRLFDTGFCDRHSGVTKSCIHSTHCTIRSLLGSMQEVLDDFLGQYTLKDMIYKSAKSVQNTPTPENISSTNPN